MKNLKKRCRTGTGRVVLSVCSAVFLASALSGCSLEKEIRQFVDQTADSQTESSVSSADTVTESASAVASSSEDSGGFLENLNLNPLNTSKYNDNIPEEDTLFRNAASDYFFYDQLSDEEKTLYDAMRTVAEHPESTEYHKRVECGADPSSDAFQEEMNRAYDALIYDHPEMFWLRDGDSSFTYYYVDSLTDQDRYVAVLQLTQPYTNYQTEVTAFNNAVDSFFSDIDTTQAAPWLALSIHDKLTDLVTYDWELADSVTSSGSTDFDLSYTAYGALVANSRGEANTALCDGYSYAYQYLLQQVEIPVVRVTGYAGNSSDNLEAHSWNVVQLDGEWYETDPTWDDVEPDLSDPNVDQTILQAAVNDTAYWNRVRHYMYDLTTDQISNYVVDDSYTYYMTTDQYSGYARFLDNSVHVRTTQEEANARDDTLSYLAPTATGTTYTYDALVN